MYTYIYILTQKKSVHVRTQFILRKPVVETKRR